MTIVVVGEALVDVVPGPGGSRDLPGGSPANVAVTLGRLGRRPTLITTLGDDARGSLVRERLSASNVTVEAVRPASRRTSSATVTLDATGSATYEFDLTWDLSSAAIAEVLAAGPVEAFHTGSIATVLEPGASAVAEAMRSLQGQALLSFDPNARPAITPDRAATVARVEELVSLADLVKVSDEDLAWYYPGVSTVEAAERWAGMGPELVVVTVGADGSLLYRRPSDGGKPNVLRCPGVRVKVADTIGAGDTYAGALIDALLDVGVSGPSARGSLRALTEEQLLQVAAWAAQAAAVTVSRPGANPPTRSEMGVAA